MRSINLLYIDDGIDPGLSKYLDHKYHNTQHALEYNIQCSELEFKPEDGYESLLKDERVREANIILIDSRLFENQTASNGKFSGEEFKIVLKKFYPFIEVIVITQNGGDEALQIVEKYNLSCGISETEYYDKALSPQIDLAVKNVVQYWMLADKMKENENWEEILKEKVLDTLNGMDAYDELKKADIDQLISAFQKVQEKLDG